MRNAPETRPTGHLIASDKESGKAIYGAENKKIGSIERVMVDETSGEIAYAVLNFGGFLGTGNEQLPSSLEGAQIRPRPWRLPV
jgi:hypothetical protein